MRPRRRKPRKKSALSKRLNARRNGRRLRALPQRSRLRASPLSDLDPTMSNSVLKSNAFFGRERSPPGADRRSARAAAAGVPPAPKSYHNRGPRHRLERLAKALDPRVDLVGWAEIEDQHVIFAGMDRGFEAARQLDAPLRAEPALEYGELEPAPVACISLNTRRQRRSSEIS